MLQQDCKVENYTFPSCKESKAKALLTQDEKGYELQWMGQR